MSRHKAEISEREVSNYAKLGATNQEIADMVGCSEATIRGRFCEIVAKSRSERKIKLRQMQWKSAEAGNVTMQIWLGKNELGQVDQQKIDHDGKLEVILKYVNKSSANEN
jgi:hypothetical protein